jgi:hypothetical protein
VELSNTVTLLKKDKLFGRYLFFDRYVKNIGSMYAVKKQKIKSDLKKEFIRLYMTQSSRNGKMSCLVAFIKLALLLPLDIFWVCG